MSQSGHGKDSEFENATEFEQTVLERLDAEVERARAEADRGRAFSSSAPSSLWAELDEELIGPASGEHGRSERMSLRFEQALDQASLGSAEHPPRKPALGGSGSKTSLTRWGALAAAVLIGILLGAWWQERGAARRAEARLADAYQNAALFGLTHRSASQRLQAVAFAQEAGMVSDRPDVRVLEALLQAVAQDPSDNVRLAAVEALTQYADQQPVQEGLLGSLRRQNSPAVLVEAAAAALPHLDAQTQQRVRSEAAARAEVFGPEIATQIDGALAALTSQLSPEI